MARQLPRGTRPSGSPSIAWNHGLMSILITSAFNLKLQSLTFSEFYMFITGSNHTMRG